jgi:hypothetical protein
MTECRSLTAGQHRRARLLNRRPRRPANREHSKVDPKQPLTTASIGDRSVPETQPEQLFPRDVPLLAQREGGDCGFTFDLMPIWH